jgi:hypothetical protein
MALAASEPVCFERALRAANQCNLPAMQEAWRQLGSPSLDGWTGSYGATAIDLLYLGFQDIAHGFGFDRDRIVKVENIDEIIAWLQGLGSRFTCKDLYHYGALEDLCAEGLDLTGMDLLQLEQDWDSWGGPMGDDLSLTATIFSSEWWGDAGDESALYPFLEAGADMYPLDQPGASARSPPPLAKPPDDAVQQLLRIFWPDTYPRKPDDQYVPAEDIDVQGICDFFAAKRAKRAAKREKQRREEAWQRRRLVVLCANRVEGPKRHKDERAGLGALVRDVTAQQLLRTVVAYL